ncbi:MAG: SUMF1/EgtB/PvdO family nonheme iron enzyme [candidate division WOR-3 bacterium]
MIGASVGNYRIVEEVGRGGMGVVYKAVHQKIASQVVAVKLLSPALIYGDKAASERAAAEAESQAKLREHPNIVSLYDFVENERGLFLIMEYIAGVAGVRNLSELIRRNGALPAEELKRLFGQVLSAVGFAHRHGIIHRDLKPLNIMLSEFGAKVGDFGIARIVSGDTSIAVSGHRVGSPAYMSPEQVLDKKLTKATDIYSLGCTLYEAATGRLPFDASETSSFFEAHLQEPPIPPRQRNPAISEQLERVILKAMEKKPADRFASCEEFAAALEQEPAAPRSPLTAGPARRVVPSVQGRARAEAEALLRQAGCGVAFEGEEYSDTVPEGAVLRQCPAPGEFCAAGAAVRVTLSRGKRPEERQQPSADSRQLWEQQTVPEESQLSSADRIPSSPSPFPPPRGRGKEREGVAERGGRPAVSGERKKTGWIVAGILAVLAAVVVIAIVAGSRSRDAARTGQGDNRGQETAPTRMTALGRNSQGYEEFLWLKDSSVMIKIPAGTFTMGSNDGGPDGKPVHQVYLDEYYIDKYEVTNRQYKQFCDATGRSYPSDPDFLGMTDYFTRYPDYPVVNVSWKDAKAYCDWAGKQLPTEAEWEKAARGTDSRKYPWGNSEPTGSRCNFADRNTDYGWSDKSADDGYARTAPVGSFPSGASPYGCMDMAGNVWEWCNDWYKDNYYGSSASNNPQGPSSGLARVSRGGSWYYLARDLRCANRAGFEPSYRHGHLGFRCSRRQ